MISPFELDTGKVVFLVFAEGSGLVNKHLSLKC